MARSKKVSKKQQGAARIHPKLNKQDLEIVPAVKEPKPPYEKNKLINDTIIRWLGGSANIRTAIKSEFDIIVLAADGIPKRSLDALSVFIGVSRKNMAENILDVSVKTLERKSPATLLDKKISSHALEIAKLMQHAYEVFEDEEKAKIWLNRENRALNGKKPVELLDTLTGINMINEILGRIEEGVYS